MKDINSVLDLMERQLNCSDTFARESKAPSDGGPSAWEIQNGHIRDLLAEARSTLKTEARP